MLLNRFHLQIVFRIGLMTITCMAFAFTWDRSDKIITLINMGLLIALQAVLLIFYLNRINRDLMSFFSSVQSGDTSITFSRKKNHLSRVYKLMDQMNEKIQSARSEYAAQNRYFRTVVEHIQTGLVSVNQDGNIGEDESPVMAKKSQADNRAGCPGFPPDKDQHTA